MKWTAQQLNEYEARRKAKSNPGSQQLPASNQEPTQGGALVSPIPREATGRNRVKIVFRVFSKRPCDWDNYHIKELQDLLIASGILFSDKWSALQGEVISEKVYQKDEIERTEITIYETTLPIA